MVLIIGGAYQGKLAFAREAYALAEGDIFTCTDGHIDFSRRCIDRLEEYVLACVREEKDPTAQFASAPEKWADSILICRDLSCGVVPISAEERAWRNETGCLCQFLAARADRVSRLFCGLEQRLK
jgi:adenosyl cobinamide kinase/adenosyl cobinamide phosphate guanylyltransferase